MLSAALPQQQQQQQQQRPQQTSFKGVEVCDVITLVAGKAHVSG
jgi:hypothetical protein